MLTTLNYNEPDRVPFDLGSVQVTGIQMVGYRSLHQALGLLPVEAQSCDCIQERVRGVLSQRR